jgi:hypothetical protein
MLVQNLTHFCGQGQPRRGAYGNARFDRELLVSLCSTTYSHFAFLSR